jgi:murein L,D-transpeptidase YcbB/YkuD
LIWRKAQPARRMLQQGPVAKCGRRAFFLDPVAKAMAFGLTRYAIAACLALAGGACPSPVQALAPEALRDTIGRHAADAIGGFYARRAYKPLWYDDSRLAPRALALLAALARAEEHGLNPALYAMPQLEARVRTATGEGQAEAELALTRAFLDYAGDVSSGVIDEPRRIERLFRESRRAPASQLLEGIAAAPDAAAYLATLPPDLRRYAALKTALARYRQIERNGGWTPVTGGPPLKPGARGPRVAEIKRRLLVTGELRAAGDIEAYDADLVAALKAFQHRHGLVADGNAGAETLAAMSISVGARIEQILINLERRRWLGGHLGPRYVYINIADNDLKVVENDRTIHTARIIVGQRHLQTPVFSALMTQIEINPYWNVPRSIAINEMLPTIRRNPGYLAANGYMLLTRSGDNASTVDPLAVDWSKIGRGNFPYHIRQRPGANNALGSLLFRLPNPYNVYLHDTPARNLFEREGRFFSHGCMRVDAPMALALLLLGKQEGGAWTEARINAVIATRALTVVPLARPIPVHVTYVTAWAERDGTVHFRRDAYRRDDALLRAYKQALQARSERTGAR